MTPRRRPAVVFPLALFAAVLLAVAAASVRPVSLHAQDAAAPDEARPATTQATLDAWLAQLADRLAAAAGAADAPIQGGNGAWQLVAFGRPVVVLCDPNAGRMRVMTPVLDEHGQPVALDAAVIDRVMRANFDTALDARYALRGGQLWTVYLHPLPTLTRADFESGVWQVLTLARTYGTTFSSTDFRFGGEDAQPAPPAPAGEQTI